MISYLDDMMFGLIDPHNGVFMQCDIIVMFCVQYSMCLLLAKQQTTGYTACIITCLDVGAITPQTLLFTPPPHNPPPHSQIRNNIDNKRTVVKRFAPCEK